MTKRKDHTVSGTAIAGAGGVTAGAGLVAGGIPGVKANGPAVMQVKPGEGKGVKRAVTAVTNKRPAAKAVPGGVLGFRRGFHEGGMYGFVQEAKKPAQVSDPADAFRRGRYAGKVSPEKEVLHSMRAGKRMAGAALVGGTGAMAYGIHRARGSNVRKSQRQTDKYNASLVGAGGAGLAVSQGANKVLTGQQRRWASYASTKTDQAGKLVPAIAGRQGQKLSLRQMHRHQVRHPGEPMPKTMYPSVSDSAIKSNKKMLFSGVDTKTAEQAGKLRGAAAQGRHFSEVYGSTAKVVRRGRAPSAILASAGAGGLAVSRLKDHKVKKSAFGVEH